MTDFPGPARRNNRHRPRNPQRGMPMPKPSRRHRKPSERQPPARHGRPASPPNDRPGNTGRARREPRTGPGRTPPRSTHQRPAGHQIPIIRAQPRTRPAKNPSRRPSTKRPQPLTISLTVTTGLPLQARRRVRPRTQHQSCDQRPRLCRAARSGRQAAPGTTLRPADHRHAGAGFRSATNPVHGATDNGRRQPNRRATRRSHGPESRFSVQPGETRVHQCSEAGSRDSSVTV